jgi:hypothetical protein
VKERGAYRQRLAPFVFDIKEHLRLKSTKKQGHF